MLNQRSGISSPDNLDLMLLSNAVPILRRGCPCVCKYHDARWVAESETLDQIICEAPSFRQLASIFHSMILGVCRCFKRQSIAVGFDVILD